MKRILLSVLTSLVLSCLFTLVVLAAEPSQSDEFGEITLISDNEAISKKDDYGYSEGDYSRVVVKVPGT